jgi:hypothetical protein
MAQMIDRMEAIIPDLTQPDPTRVKRIAQSAKFARPLIPAAINAVTSYEPFQKRNLFDAVAGQGALDYDGQLNPITRRLAAVTLALSYSINLKLATAGDEALQTYHWAKRHVAKPDGGGARVFVDDMQRVVERTLNRRPKPKKSANTPPDTTHDVIPPTTPPTEGLLDASTSEAHTGPDDDEILDRVREIAEPDSSK